MSDTFLYNEEVTAEDLNNIAIDLGKADFSFFENDNPTAVSELNKITGDLVSAGVLLTDNRCRVNMVGDKITVDTGIIVFANGAKKRITETQTLMPLADVTSYVYALNDVLNNRITLNVAEAYPTEGDFVKLATLTKDLKVSIPENRALLKVDSVAQKPDVTIQYSGKWEVVFEYANTGLFFEKSDWENSKYIKSAVSIDEEFPFLMKKSDFELNAVYGFYQNQCRHFFKIVETDNKYFLYVLKSGDSYNDRVATVTLIM